MKFSVIKYRFNTHTYSNDDEPEYSGLSCNLLTLVRFFDEYFPDLWFIKTTLPYKISRLEVILIHRELPVIHQ